MYYLDMIKGRLYTYAVDSNDRRSAQTAIFEALNCLVRIMAPLLVFTAEETWQHMPHEKSDYLISSIHLADWPKANPSLLNAAADLKPAMELIPDIAKALEEKRSNGVIGSSFDAEIKLLTKDEIRYKYLGSLKDELLEVFKVSQVEIIKEDNLKAGTVSKKYPDIAVEVKKASGEKCVRCWNYSEMVGKSVKHPLICEKCQVAIGEER